MPAALASSIAYWISGLSTTGSISFGIALVAGRKRVPRPATGKMALRMGFIGSDLGNMAVDGACNWGGGLLRGHVGNNCGTRESTRNASRWVAHLGIGCPEYL